MAVLYRMSGPGQEPELLRLSGVELARMAVTAGELAEKCTAVAATLEGGVLPENFRDVSTEIGSIVDQFEGLSGMAASIQEQTLPILGPGIPVHDAGEFLGGASLEFDESPPVLSDADQLEIERAELDRFMSQD